MGTIRKARKEDAPSLFTLFNTFSRELPFFYTRALERDAPQIFLYEEDGTIVGALKLSFQKWRSTRGPRIAAIAVKKSHQGKGIGRALVEAALKELTDQGYREVWAYVKPSNRGASKFFRKMGFQEVGEALGLRSFWKPLM